MEREERGVSRSTEGGVEILPGCGPEVVHSFLSLVGQAEIFTSGVEDSVFIPANGMRGDGVCGDGKIKNA
jgi:hypothetical protein